MQCTSKVKDLLRRLDAESELYVKRGQACLASMIESIRDEVVAAIQADEERLVTISEAAILCGYSAGHLHKCVREGLLATEQDGGRRLVRLAAVQALRLSAAGTGADGKEDIPSIPRIGRVRSSTTRTTSGARLRAAG
jgi:hypothetical protein